MLLLPILSLESLGFKMEENILFSIDSQNIAHITLNRPDVHNALDDLMLQTLIDHLEKLHHQPTLRALILRGNGKSLCAGADISWMEKMASHTFVENKIASSYIASVMHLLDTLPVPTLAYAQGSVRGGGLGLLACSDIVISDNKASFSFSEVKIGLAPAIIAPYVMRAIGLRQARRYFITGEKFGAQKAYEIGLVHEVVQKDQVEERITQLIHEILTSGPQAIRSTKKLIQDCEGIREDLHAKMADLNAEIRQSEECQEGFKAFLNKKNPPWISHD